MRLPFAAAVLLALSGCYPWTPPALSPVTQPAGPATGAAARSAPAAARAPVTILVSIDGFRPDYLRQGNTPTLDRLARDGVSAAMRPVFPTMTFPNHYSMVTGLWPGRHGIINNTMLDPARPGVVFRTADSAQVRDGFWWDGAEPLWVSAERAGIRTGTMFWPGSEAEIRGLRPSAWVPYAAQIDASRRVDFVLDWLRRPLGDRPGFLTLYFDTIDKTSHNAGYDSPDKLAAIRESDAGVARLLAGLAALGQPANLIVVSDHGMAAVPADHLIDVQDMVRNPALTVLAEGPQLSVFVKSGGEDPAARLAQLPHAKCWPRATIPTRFRLADSPRAPDWLCLADGYWRFVGEPPRAYVKGEHGFDPADPAMAALFIAVGPAFGSQRRIASFDNVDLYPLLRRLIGLPPVSGTDASDALSNKVLR
ncbi:MAG: ectonucleotide pyrophosphatase/phosphodiesterase [Pseudomonadota bacterium]